MNSRHSSTGTQEQLQAAKHFKSSIVGLLNNSSLSQIVLDHILKLYSPLIKYHNSQESMQEINADLLCFNYGNSIKMLILSDNYVIDDDDFWLARLHYIESGPSGYRLARNDFDVVEVDSRKSFYPIIHHNHFGHFLGDSMGLVEHARLVKQGASLITIDPKVSIRHEIEVFKHPASTVTYLPRPAIGRGVLYKSLSLLLHTDAPWLYKLFLAQKRLRSIVKASHQNKVCFLLRSNESGSRISNIEEVREVAERIGADIISVENYSLVKQVNLLSQYEVIVTESGSCHLNAMMCARHDSKIIALTPAPMIMAPSPDMLVGGWRYIPFHPQVSLLPSQSCVASIERPMSAWQCSYSKYDIKRAVEKLHQ